jgi:hypothetical protein
MSVELSHVWQGNVFFLKPLCGVTSFKSHLHTKQSRKSSHTGKITFYQISSVHYDFKWTLQFNHKKIHVYRHFKLCDRYSIPAAGFLIIISPQSHVRRVLPVWLYSTQHMQGGQISIMTRSYYRSELLPDECLQSCWVIVYCIWKCSNPHVYSLFKQYHYNSRIIFHANTKWVTYMQIISFWLPLTVFVF